MKRTRILLLIGLVAVAAAVITERWAGHRVSSLQLAISDWILVQADGPRLGRRPVRSDISLVLFDVRTAVKLGYVHSYDDDIRLYRKLSDAKVKIVFDTRMVAAAQQEAFDEIRPMLDAMRELSPGGSLMRDVWLSAPLLAKSDPEYEILTAQHIVNAHPHAVSSLRARLYPIAHLTNLGPKETAPLQIYRRLLGLQSVEFATVGKQLRECGIMTQWHKQSPDLVPQIDIPASPYMVDDVPIHWHSFLSASVLVPPAAFWVSYDPLMSQYERHSFLDVLDATDLSHLKNKIVVIGFSPETDVSSDVYDVPSRNGKAAPAEVAAAAIQTLLDGRLMRDAPRAAVLVGVVFLCFALALIGGWMQPIQSVLVSLALILAYYACCVAAYRGGWYADFVIAPIFGVLSGFAGGVHGAWSSVRSRQRVIDLFGRYVPRAVVSQLILESDLRTLTVGGVRRDVSVLFADIRGFTSFSEDLAPEEVVRQLNSLLEIMVACTFEFDGTLDKFIGDAILVLFNAPLDQEDHVERAVHTAIAMQRRLSGHATGLSVGIGIHRGAAVVGNIGTPERLEYTAIGSTVNVASRLCALARPGQIIISDAIKQALGQEHETLALAPVQVKGIKTSLQTYQIVLNR